MASADRDPVLCKKGQRALIARALNRGAIRIRWGGEMGPGAVDDDAIGRLQRPGGSDGVLRGESAAAESGLELQLDVELGTPGSVLDGPQNVVEEFRIAHGQRDSPLGRLDCQPRRNWIEDEHRRLDPGIPERERLVEGGDRQAIGAPGGEMTRDVQQSVTVGVSLDDRFDPHPVADGPPDRREIGAESVEVDLQPAGPGQRWETGGTKAILDRLACLEGAQPALPLPSASRGPKPNLFPERRRSARVVSRRRDMAIASGRSEASRPASPSRSRIASPASPWR